MLKAENLDRYWHAVALAIDVVGGEAPQCPAENAKEVEALRELRGEIREAISVRNQARATVHTGYDDENLIEPPDRTLHNAFKV